MKWKREIIGAVLFLILLGIDQLGKSMAVTHLKDNAAVPLIKGVFELQYLENHGAAFGMLQKQRGFLLCFTVVILVVLVFLYWKLPDGKRYLPLRLIGILTGAGAVGNLIDRMMQGYVIDFFYFKLIDFPVFNVADCYVVVAAFLLFFLICFYYKDEDFDFLKKKV